MVREFGEYINKLQNKVYLTEIERNILYINSRVLSQDKLIEELQKEIRKLKDTKNEV